SGAYCDTSRLANVLAQAGSDCVAALWDVHHPFRFHQETPDQTLNNLGAFIKHIHIKDSLMEKGQVTYKMMGEGDIPIPSIMQALHSINYEGYVTLEWLKSYAPDL
ncbi:MAG: TIM barrel protein, partial [Clostridiales bacterium]